MAMWVPLADRFVQWMSSQFRQQSFTTAQINHMQKYICLFFLIKLFCKLQVKVFVWGTEFQRQIQMSWILGSVQTLCKADTWRVFVIRCSTSTKTLSAFLNYVCVCLKKWYTTQQIQHSSTKYNQHELYNFVETLNQFWVCPDTYSDMSTSKCKKCH